MKTPKEVLRSLCLRGLERLGDAFCPFLQHAAADFVKVRMIFPVGAQFPGSAADSVAHAFEYLADAGRGAAYS